jgi:predicted ribosomally synthesized peptide with nif11-like leader
MSKENLEQFVNQVADSEELQTRIGEEIDADALIALGAEHNCEFSADDLAENGELSDEELDGVTGGLVIVAAFARPGPMSWGRSIRITNVRSRIKHAPQFDLDDKVGFRGLGNSDL